MSDVFYPTLIRDMDQEDGAGYIALVLDLPGCFSDGDTPEEAMVNARLAALEWIDEAIRLGREVPEPNSSFARAHQGRSHATDTIKKQQNLIHAQDELITAHQRTIETLREQIEALCDVGRSDFDPMSWGGMVRTVSVPAGILSNTKDLQH